MSDRNRNGGGGIGQQEHASDDVDGKEAHDVGVECGGRTEETEPYEVSLV
jgi:hypothetical protein